MKKTILSLLAMLCIYGGVCAQYSWQSLPNAPKSYRLDDIYFLNPNQGWAISPYYGLLENPSKFGQIYRTIDAGKNWQLLKDSSLTYYRSVGFADSLTGWVGNLGDTTATPDTIPFYHTVNGGITWSPVTNLPSPRPKGICGISVVTDSVIYAYGRYYGPAVLMKTTDKGTTWKTQSMSTYASGLVDGYFFNKDTGFVTGGSPTKNATILSTFDGGTTWKTRYLSTRNDTDGVWKLSFPSRNIGYASIEYWGTNWLNRKTYFLKTTDGGMTWKENSFVTNYDLQGIGFINDTTGWIGGWSGTNFKTTDGGLNWNWDITFGVATPPYNTSGDYNMNRFRRFGDTLMYASGNTVYKLQVHNQTGIHELQNQIEHLENYPNPFSTETTISYSLYSSDIIFIEVYNSMGEKISSENLGTQNPGEHIYLLKVNLTSGIYFCILHSENGRVTKKIVIER